MGDLSTLDNERNRLLQASRIRLIMRELSSCISKEAIKYRNDPSNPKSLLDVLEPICRCFGNIAVEAVSLADNGNVYLLKDPVHGRNIYEVCGTHSQCTYTCLPMVNYCQCSYFLQEVIKLQRSFTCPHVLAIWFAELLGKVTTRTVGFHTISLAIKHLSTHMHEFQ